MSNENQNNRSVNELYEINWETQEIFERDTVGNEGTLGKKVYRGLDRSLTSYGDDYFPNPDDNDQHVETSHNKNEGPIYDRLPWSQTLTRAYNIPDGILIAIFYSDILDEWIISTTGEHTMRIIDGDPEERESECNDPPLWGKEAAHLNVADSPFWSDIKEILIKAKFLPLLSIFKKNHCYTFILSSPKVRTTGPIVTDLPDRQEDLGFGIFHFLTRDISNNFIECHEILMGVRQPLIRALRDKQDCIDQINMCGPSNVGIIISELVPSRGRQSCRKAFFFNCVWTKLFYLNQVQGVERREMGRNEKGDLVDELTEDEIKLIHENTFFASLITEFIVYNEVNVIQTYHSLREKYLKFILYISKKLYSYINDELLKGVTDRVEKSEIEEAFLEKDVSEILEIIM